MYRISINVSGQAQVDRVLAGLEERALDMRPVWPLVAQAFQAIMAKAFATEGASTDKGAWKQLTPRTQKERAALGFPPAHPILKRTGALERALTIGEGAFLRGEPQRFQYQLASEPASVASFSVHQKTRPIVSLTGDDRNAIMHPIRLFLTGRDPSAPRRAPIR